MQNSGIGTSGLVSLQIGIAVQEILGVSVVFPNHQPSVIAKAGPSAETASTPRPHRLEKSESRNAFHEKSCERHLCEPPNFIDVAFQFKKEYCGYLHEVIFFELPPFESLAEEPFLRQTMEKSAPLGGPNSRSDVQNLRSRDNFSSPLFRATTK